MTYSSGKALNNAVQALPRKRIEPKYEPTIIYPNTTSSLDELTHDDIAVLLESNAGVAFADLLAQPAGQWRQHGEGQVTAHVAMSAQRAERPEAAHGATQDPELAAAIDRLVQDAQGEARGPAAAADRAEHLQLCCTGTQYLLCIDFEAVFNLEHGVLSYSDSAWRSMR